MFNFPDSPSVGQLFSGGGQQWQWDGTAWVSAGLLATASMIDRIYLTGTSTWNKPAGLAYAEIEGVAGGGSGAPAIATGAGVYSFGSAGGGGSWGKKLFAASDLPASVAITVGAGGASSSAGQGNDGGDTTFGSLIVLKGGGGGKQGANTTTTGVIGPSNVSAVPTGVDIGSPSSMGGMAAVVPSAWSHIGPGGSTPYGQGSPYLTGSTGQVGATGYGSGSSGCVNAPSSSLKASAAAQPGFLRVREFYTQVSAAQAQTTADAQNRIINGAMQHSQENGDAASVAAAANAAYYFADQTHARWSVSPGTMAAVRHASIKSPKGGRIGVLTTSVTKAVLAATDYALISQNIEGSCVADLQWGTANAKPVVVSFQVNSGYTGKFSFRLANSTSDRSYVGQFDIAVANTWTQITALVPGDTTGTWLTDTGVGLRLDIVVGVGSSYVGTAGAWQAGNFYAGPGQTNGVATAGSFLVGELGIYADPNNTGKAPPFEVPDYAEELAKCLRYYHPLMAQFFGAVFSNSSFAWGTPTVPMRTTPTLSGVNVTASNFPATVGTLTYLSGSTPCGIIREARTATAGAANNVASGNYQTTITANARM